MIKRWRLKEMFKVEILPFDDSHIDGILNISMLSFPVTWSRESYEKEIENKYARYIVAVRDGVVVGFGGLWLIVDEGHITNIAVHPEFRGYGIGSMIVDALLDICRLEGIIAVTLEVRKSNIAAQNLYGKFGFLNEGLRKGYYEDNKEDAVIMWKRDL